ncbi:MAG: hypothetical protein AAGD10_03215 [Myxococcota bacterium]
MLLALGIRMAISLLVNSTTLWLSFSPDAIGWENLGTLFRDYLLGRQIDPPSFLQSFQSQTFYASLNGLFLLAFGSSRFTASLFNCFVGVGVALLSAQLARRLHGEEARRRCLLLCLFFPSLVLWSGLNLREVWAHGAILLFVLSGMRIRERVDLVSLSLLFGALFAVGLLRPYLIPLLGLSLAASFFVIRLRQLPAIVAAILALVMVSKSFDFGLFGVDELISVESLQTAQRLRSGLAYGGSAYGQNADTSTLSGALTYLPWGLLQFYFSPLPWSVRSWQQLLAAPEVFIWAGLAYQGFRQILSDLARKGTASVLPVLVVLTLSLAYSLVSGNEGTAFRHRAQVVVLILPFTAAWQTRRSRTAEQGGSRLDASSRIQGPEPASGTAAGHYA